jgi:ATP-dependent helicase/nuclease subunit B
MGAIRAGERLLAMSRALSGLGGRAPVAEHVQTLLDFLKANERIDVPEGVRARHLRAREAIRVTLRSLADAYGRFDAAEVDGREVAGLARRWIESQTFAPRTGDAGVHVIDADSARFGDFEYAHVAGLVEGEWPDRARRNIFYSHAVLRELGWSSESDRLAGVRSAFADLLRLPSRRLSVSAFTLEADALVSVSPLADEVARAGLSVVEDDLPAHRIFSEELLSEEPVELGSLGPLEKQWASRRVRFHQTARPPSYHGFTSPHPVRPYSLSALERYQDCPFKFFASDVLRLEEAPEDQSALTPRARGRFVHEVLQRFFEAWDAGGRGAITPARVDEARALMAEVAEPLLAALSEADAALERARLFGSAIAAGWIDLVLADEASSGGPVEERWLEHRFDGEFALGRGGSRRVALKGVADRVDLLPGRRLRVIDYKSGRPPDPARALQAPAYALCVQEQLEADRGEHWEIEEASYLALAGRRSRVGVPAAGDSNAADVLRDAARRLTEIVDGIGRGEFPPRPHDTAICEYCAYVTVCRKDYVHV